jgi:hypothetical protein
MLLDVDPCCACTCPLLQTINVLIRGNIRMNLLMVLATNLFMKASF